MTRVAHIAGLGALMALAALDSVRRDNLFADDDFFPIDFELERSRGLYVIEAPREIDVPLKAALAMPVSSRRRRVDPDVPPPGNPAVETRQMRRARERREQKTTSAERLRRSL